MSDQETISREDFRKLLVEAGGNLKKVSLPSAPPSPVRKFSWRTDDPDLRGDVRGRHGCLRASVSGRFVGVAVAVPEVGSWVPVSTSEGVWTVCTFVSPASARALAAQLLRAAEQADGG